MIVENNNATHDSYAQEIAIQELADRFGIAQDEVAVLYKNVFTRLSHGAIIKDYLTVLVTHEVWDTLQQKSSKTDDSSHLLITN